VEDGKLIFYLVWSLFVGPKLSKSFWSASSLCATYYANAPSSFYTPSADFHKLNG